MTKETLKSYISTKEEIAELKYKLEHMGEDDEFVGNDVINDYRSGFPVPQSVVGVDSARYYHRRNVYTDRITKLQGHCKEIEDWIENIPDSLTRRIFRMHYIDGVNQNKIAKKIHTDQSTVSRRIKETLIE